MTAEEHAQLARNAMRLAGQSGRAGADHYATIATAHATMALYERRRAELERRAVEQRVASTVPGSHSRA